MNERDDDDDNIKCRYRTPFKKKKSLIIDVFNRYKITQYSVPKLINITLGTNLIP